VTWIKAIEDKIVSLLPYFPCRNGENLHEEGALRLKLRLMHHLKEFHREIPPNSKMLPTKLTERAAEEQMESRFFSIVVAEHTIIGPVWTNFRFLKTSVCLLFLKSGF
jgi:hypothetical protein